MPSLPWTRALVTGASSGIGDAFARQLAAGGVHVVLVARDKARLEKLAETVKMVHGVDAEVLAADLADSAQLAEVERRLASSEAPVELLVNNAGFGTSGRFVDLDDAEEAREIAVNVTAVLRLSHAALGHMIPLRRGAVLNVASMAGLQATPFSATYGATKAFVISFSEALHEEVRGTGVSVTALLPGFTRTEFQDRADVDATSVPGFMWATAADVAQAGLAAAAKGDALCVPGAVNAAIAAGTAPLPRWLKRRVAGIVSKRV